MPQENLSMLPSLFKFQACKSCNAQLYFGMISSSSWETGNIGLLQVSSPCLSFHFSFSSCALLFPFFSPSSSLLHVQDRNNMVEISCTQPRGDGGLGGRAGEGDDGAEGGPGLQSLKISRAAEREAGPRHSSGVPSISAILVAFSISEVCLIS